jgi:hypothetical protein
MFSMEVGIYQVGGGTVLPDLGTTSLMSFTQLVRKGYRIVMQACKGISTMTVPLKFRRSFLKYP